VLGGSGGCESEGLGELSLELNQLSSSSVPASKGSVTFIAKVFSFSQQYYKLLSQVFLIFRVLARLIVLAEQVWSMVGSMKSIEVVASSSQV
jgi:hypothetical protein